MSDVLSCGTAIDADPANSEVEFGRSSEGFPVACVGDSAFAMLPARDGR